jgi:hypothetical protein
VRLCARRAIKQKLSVRNKVPRCVSLSFSGAGFSLPLSGNVFKDVIGVIVATFRCRGPSSLPLFFLWHVGAIDCFSLLMAGQLYDGYPFP